MRGRIRKSRQRCQSTAQLGIITAMDALRRDDLERARRASEKTRAEQALAAMRTGIELRRTVLRERHPEATDAEIEQLLRHWLARDD
jgi:hypothetical protein